MSDEEKETGISVDDLTEREAPVEELVSREDTATADADFVSKQQDKGKETAEHIQKKAMENLRETKKGKSEKDGSPKRRKSGQRCAQPLVDFLRDKTDADRHAITTTGAAKNERSASCSITESSRKVMLVIKHFSC